MCIHVSPLFAVQPSAGLCLRLLPLSGSALLSRGHIGCPRGTGNGQYANCGHAKRAICCLLNHAQLRQQCNTAVWCLIKITAYLTSSREEKHCSQTITLACIVMAWVFASLHPFSSHYVASCCVFNTDCFKIRYQAGRKHRSCSDSLGLHMPLTIYNSSDWLGS